MLNAVTNDVICVRRARALFCLSLALLAVAFFILPDIAFADSFSGKAESDVVYNLTSYKKIIEDVYHIAFVILIPVASVSFAAAAFMMFAGNEQSVAKGKKQAIITLFTVAAFLLLPAALNFGVNSGKNQGWTPQIGNHEKWTKEHMPDFSTEKADKGEGGKSSKKGDAAKKHSNGSTGDKGSSGGTR